jgi:hypothetical protein
MKIVFLFFLPFVFARNIVLLGDSLTMDLKNFNYNLFDPTDTVTNYARSAFNINLVHYILDPYRNVNLLNTELSKNENTATYTSNQVIIPNIVSNPPDVICIMVGLRNVLDGFANSNSIINDINDYGLLLDKIKQLLPSTTVLINSVLPTDNTEFSDYYKNLIINTIREFNQQLNVKVDSRNDPNFHYIDLFDSFLLNDRSNPELFLQQNDMLLHPSLQGYVVWKQKLNEVLFSTNNPVVYIRTNHWDGLDHRNYFQLFINDKYIGSFMETESIIKDFQLSNEIIYKIEIIMSTW